LTEDNAADIVAWDQKYITGISIIDEQHKELVVLTNQLYRACLDGREAAGMAFKDSMSRMVDYVRFHFDAEQKILQRIKYPQYAEHKQKHDALVRSILKASKEHGRGHKFVPNNFVRTLKDWIFGHIAIEDKLYAVYAEEQKNKGLLSAAEIDSP
jgi:hemerythrin